MQFFNIGQKCATTHMIDIRKTVARRCSEFAKREKITEIFNKFLFLLIPILLITTYATRKSPIIFYANLITLTLVSIKVISKIMGFTFFPKAQGVIPASVPPSIKNAPIITKETMLSCLNTHPCSAEQLLGFITKEIADVRFPVKEKHGRAHKIYGEIDDNDCDSVSDDDAEEMDSKLPPWGTATLTNIIATNELQFSPQEVNQLLDRLIEVRADFTSIDRTSVCGFEDIQNTPLKSLIACGSGNNDYDSALAKLIDYINTLPLEERTKIIMHPDRFPGGTMTPLYFLIRQGKEGLALKLLKAYEIGPEDEAELKKGVQAPELHLTGNLRNDEFLLACHSFGTSKEIRLGSCVKAIMELIRKRNLKLLAKKNCYIDALIEFSSMQVDRLKGKIDLEYTFNQWTAPTASRAYKDDLYRTMVVYHNKDSVKNLSQPEENPEKLDEFISLCRNLKDKKDHLNEEETRTRDKIREALAIVRILYISHTIPADGRFGDEYRVPKGANELDYKMLKWDRLTNNLNGSYQIMEEILAEIGTL